MLGVILNVMKHQSSVTGMELNIHVCLGPLLLLLVCPCNDGPKHFRKQTCWFITSGSTCLLDVTLNNYFALNCVFILKKTEEKNYTHCNVFLKNYEGFFTLFS